MAKSYNIKRGNTWTPRVVVTAPFTLSGFTALAGIYDKPDRTNGIKKALVAATVTATATGGDIDLLLAATDCDTLVAGTYYLAVQLYRVGDGYVHEIDYQQVTVSGDTIAETS